MADELSASADTALTHIHICQDRAVWSPNGGFGLPESEKKKPQLWEGNRPFQFIGIISLPVFLSTQGGCLPEGRQ